MSKRDKIRAAATFLTNRETSLSGSGFDTSWEREETASGVRCTTSFHCLNENGYYDGWARFEVFFSFDSEPTDFKLHFLGTWSQRLNQKHLLREHLEDTIYHHIREVKHET